MNALLEAESKTVSSDPELESYWSDLLASFRNKASVTTLPVETIANKVEVETDTPPVQNCMYDPIKNLPFAGGVYGEERFEEPRNQFGF